MGEAAILEHARTLDNAALDDLIGRLVDMRSDRSVQRARDSSQHICGSIFDGWLRTNYVARPAAKHSAAFAERKRLIKEVVQSSGASYGKRHPFRINGQVDALESFNEQRMFDQRRQLLAAVLQEVNGGGGGGAGKSRSHVSYARSSESIESGLGVTVRFY